VTLGGIAALFALVVSGKFYAMAGEGRTIGLGEQPLWFPHAAVEFAGQDDMPRRFLSFHDGYAALYEYHHGPGRKVFVDARLEVIGADLYERYMALRDWIQTDNPAWTRELDALERPAVLIGHADNAVLGATLMASPGWRCVWFDPMVAVYVHKSYDGAVAAHRVDLAERHFAPDPETDPHGIPALLASAEGLWKYAADLQSRGRGDLARSLVLLGLDYGRRIRQADPEGLDGWKVLGKLEATREPAAAATMPKPVSRRYRLPFDPVFDLSSVRATYDLRRALDVAPRDFMTLLLLVKLFEERGMDEAAEPLLDGLGRVVPINPDQAAIVEGAAAQREQVQARLGPPAPASWDNLSELDLAVTTLLSHGRVRSAAEFLERAYPGEPRPWEVTDRLATLWLHLGEPARARDFWGKSVAPPRPAVRAARVAVTHLVEGDFDAARRQYQAALTADPGLFEARYGLAVLEQDAGRAAAALSEARQAVAVAPGDVARSAAEAIIRLVRPYAGEEEASPQRHRGHKEEILVR
jgi:tetratricopeptide (TPR) repeat protein